ncbi:hypothetical protein TIFTF001_037968 [Ficus carica]|uniref:Uncharacterized protein n=1 Tax=Ficus carica TaxID=3494 RepID=A0AA88JDA2_FICCA|nr:hypothetical protein TIFTF001_037968 [Ficus carica]
MTNHPFPLYIPFPLSPLYAVTLILRHAAMSSDEAAAEIRPSEFLFCPILSQLVPLASPASKVLMATSDLQSHPHIRDPATGYSFSPDLVPNLTAPPSSASNAPIELARRRSGDRERGDPNLLHSRSLAPAVERRSTMASSA